MSFNGALPGPVDRRYHFGIRLAPEGCWAWPEVWPHTGDALTPSLGRRASALIKVPDRFLDMLAQQPPLIRGHHAVPWRPLGRLRIALRCWHGRHGLLQFAIAVERLLHPMLSAHEAAIEVLLWPL
jgi:hypothetical protein